MEACESVLLSRTGPFFMAKMHYGIDTLMEYADTYVLTIAWIIFMPPSIALLGNYQLSVSKL